MNGPAVKVDRLVKVFDVPERDEGLKAATKSLVRRRTREVRAVDGISFEIAPARSSASSGRTARARRRR
jgi:ABC-2 type transport system ATP-binding protein